MDIVTMNLVSEYLSTRFTKLCSEYEFVRLSEIDETYIRSILMKNLDLNASRGLCVKFLKTLRSKRGSDRLVVTKLQRIDSNEKIIDMLKTLKIDRSRITSDRNANSALVLIRKSIADKYKLTYTENDLSDFSSKSRDNYDFKDEDVDSMIILEKMKKSELLERIESHMEENEVDFSYESLNQIKDDSKFIYIDADFMLDQLVKPYLRANSQVLGRTSLNSYLTMFFNLQVSEEDAIKLMLYHSDRRVGLKNATSFIVKLYLYEESVTKYLRSFLKRQTEFSETSETSVLTTDDLHALESYRGVKFDLLNLDLLQSQLLRQGAFVKMRDLIEFIRTGLLSSEIFYYDTSLVLQNRSDEISELKQDILSLVRSSTFSSVEEIEKFLDLDVASNFKSASIHRVLETHEEIQILNISDLEFLKPTVSEAIFGSDILEQYRSLKYTEILVEKSKFEELSSFKDQIERNERWFLNRLIRFEECEPNDEFKKLLDRHEKNAHRGRFSTVKNIRNVYLEFARQSAAEENRKEIEAILDLDLRSRFAQHVADNYDRLSVYVDEALSLEK